MSFVSWRITSIAFCAGGSAKLVDEVRVRSQWRSSAKSRCAAELGHGAVGLIPELVPLSDRNSSLPGLSAYPARTLQLPPGALRAPCCRRATSPRGDGAEQRLPQRAGRQLLRAFDVGQAVNRLGAVDLLLEIGEGL